MKASHDALERRLPGCAPALAPAGASNGTRDEIEGTTSWTPSDRKEAAIALDAALPAAPGVDACPALTVRR